MDKFCHVFFSAGRLLAPSCLCCLKFFFYVKKDMANYWNEQFKVQHQWIIDHEVIKANKRNNTNIKSNKSKNEAPAQRKKTEKYGKNKIKHKRYQHNTDDGGQAMGEELIHVQVKQAHRWRKRAAIGVMRQKAMHFNTFDCNNMKFCMKFRLNLTISPIPKTWPEPLKILMPIVNPNPLPLCISYFSCGHIKQSSSYQLKANL